MSDQRTMKGKVCIAMIDIHETEMFVSLLIKCHHLYGIMLTRAVTPVNKYQCNQKKISGK